MFAPWAPELSAFTVRIGLDLYLGALGLPAGSEILTSALSIKEMAKIAKHHGLVPIPDLAVDALRKAYPEIDTFFPMQHAVDPDDRFTSRFFEQHRKEVSRMAARAG